MSVLNNWIAGVDYPLWGDKEEYKMMITEGYLLEGETPKQAYKRVSKSVAQRLGKPTLANAFFELIWNNWLCLASPVLANCGTQRGFPISCFGIHIDDSMDDIGRKVWEYLIMGKKGGGVGINFDDVRPAGSSITDIGKSSGTRPFIKLFDQAVVASKQGKVRKSAGSVNMNIRHGDFHSFLDMREPKGDIGLQCRNLQHTAIISDEFMEKVEAGEQKEQQLYLDLLHKRFEKGQPFIFYEGNANKQNPLAYVNNNLKVSMTNICTEIMLYTDPQHSFVCCLSSMNLARYDEWKDTDAIKLAIWFLDGVMEEFIDKAKMEEGFANAVRFARKSRPLGLGVLGWHSFLQSKNIPFISALSTGYTNTIFKKMKEQAEEASRELAEEYGEPIWCKGTGMRNSHLLAIAPTVSNSILSGSYSPGIEPCRANIFTQKTAKGSFSVKNPYLIELLEKKGMNTTEVWNQIKKDKGSVQNLDFLTEDEKKVFLNFEEINQIELVRQAGVRQKYIDQAQSLNLCFPKEVTPKFFYDVHMECWKVGIKSVYYVRTESILRADMMKDLEDQSCSSCDG